MILADAKGGAQREAAPHAQMFVAVRGVAVVHV